MSDYTQFSKLGLKIELERIEALLRRALAAASVAVGFAGPVVANEAAAAAFPLSDTPGSQNQVFVLSHRSIWTKRNGVAGTQGVPPVVPHQVIAATAGPAGVLCRTQYSDPALRTAINDIFIDPANPAANDENDGLTVGAPLKTGYELFRRWGWNTSKPIVSCNFATSPDGFLNIHVMSDLLAPDSLPLKFTVGAEVSVRIVSPLLATNIIHTGTLTNAVIAMNPAVPLGGTRLTVRDNAVAGWGPAEQFNRRVRMLNGTAGPAAGHNGGTFQAQTDALATPGQVQCSACQATNEPGFSVVPTTLTPSVGDTYVIEKLVVVNLGDIDIDQEINTTFGGFNVFVNFVNINLPSLTFLPGASGETWVPKGGVGVSGIFFNFYQCTVDRTIDVSLSQTILIACYGSAAVIGTGAGKFNPPISGGGWNGAIPGSSVQVVFGSASVESAIDYDCVINKPDIVAFTQAVRNFAVWNQAADAVNLGGHGVLIGFGGVGGFFGQRGSAQCKGLIWGNGNAGAGILVGAACNGVGAPQNITGLQGDFKLADNPVVGRAVYFDPVTSLYAPVGGQTTSWALLAAAKGAPGFGGGALWPDQQSNWVANETTA